ncbi:hypothetical protein PHYPSEUDO_010919 [Phytophthora pseudosyringae]|uniref:Uncharacterized protein n=1 Tax=Phytophthora pseudosyringae TaxID=221518 RepID=A0A8T1V970_9STRA|nr:hypothetical protein PHYPSEUDO_010919 [Phytophthora pseudosyringae]
MLQRGSSAVSLASSTASEDDDRSFLTPKRRRGGEEQQPPTSGSENSGDIPNGGRPKVCKTMRPETSKLTASQEAIVHFLHHYAKELPQPAKRLGFAKHLTHNVAEAQMYNVLDPATQLEYVREFARSPATN